MSFDTLKILSFNLCFINFITKVGTQTFFLPAYGKSAHSWAHSANENLQRQGHFIPWRELVKLVRKRHITKYEVLI